MPLPLSIQLPTGPLHLMLDRLLTTMLPTPGCIFLESLHCSADEPLRPPRAVPAFGTSALCFAVSEMFLAVASPGGRCCLYDLAHPAHARLQAFRLNAALGDIVELAGHPHQPMCDTRSHLHSTCFLYSRAQQCHAGVVARVRRT